MQDNPAMIHSCQVSKYHKTDINSLKNDMFPKHGRDNLERGIEDVD